MPGTSRRNDTRIPDDDVAVDHPLGNLPAIEGKGDCLAKFAPVERRPVDIEYQPHDREGRRLQDSIAAALEPLLYLVGGRQRRIDSALRQAERLLRLRQQGVGKLLERRPAAEETVIGLKQVCAL